MWRNHLKIAFRSFLKQKGLTLINILGLSIGLACFNLFLLYAVNEFSYDRFHEKADQLYRVYRWSEAMEGSEAGGDPYMPMPLGPAMKQDFPDVENFARFREGWGEDFVRVNNTVSRMEISFADPQFFEMFNFPLKYGDAATALKDISSVVLTEKTAIQLFGESNPIGKTLEIKLEDDFTPFTVAAVAEDLPTNTSVTFGILGNFEKWASSKWAASRRESWTNSAYFTYVQIRSGSGLPHDPDRLMAFRKKYYPDEEAKLRAKGYWKGEGAPIKFGLQPIREIHTSTQVLGGTVANVNPKNIWTLLAIAAGVLLIAIINFTTLSIGRSAGRAREVGVRKVVGGNRRQLVNQFLSEAMLMSFISAGIALLLDQWLMSYFNELSGRELVFSLRQYPEIGGLTLGATVIAGLLAGSYPALVLSGFKPVEVLKSKIRLGGSNFFTKSLVTVQFVLSVGLIISTLVILKQLNFMRSQNPGFNKENVVVVDAGGSDSKTIYPRFRQALTGNPQVLGVASAELSFGEGTGWSRTGFDYKGESKEVYEYYVDDDFLKVLGMQLLEGRGFEEGRQDGPNRSVIINEAMVKDFGWTTETAVGQELTGYSDNGKNPLVIGVVKDFNYRPFSEQVRPQMFHQFEDYAPFKFFVRIPSGDPAPALKMLNNTWAKVAPALPFKYSFLDEDLNNFYHAEQRWSDITGWAGGISVFLACLGLLGLASLAAANRTKEIGIRKVMGASLTGIIGLLSKDFLKLVGIAFLIASPLAWYFMHQWLQDFAYRIDMGWKVFAVAGIAAVAVAFLTVSIQSLRAALANPVKSLRSE